MRVWTLFEDTNPQTRHAGAAREDARTGPLSGTSRRKALTPEMAEEWAREIGPEGGLEDFLGGGDMLTPPPALAAREQPPPLPRARPRARQKRVRTPLQQQANQEITRRLRADPAYAAEVARQREENSQRMAADRARKRAEKTEVAADLLLEKVHDASGSVITANSMRLRTLPDGPERDVARKALAAHGGAPRRGEAATRHSSYAGRH